MTPGELGRWVANTACPFSIRAFARSSTRSSTLISPRFALPGRVALVSFGSELLVTQLTDRQLPYTIILTEISQFTLQRTNRRNHGGSTRALDSGLTYSGHRYVIPIGNGRPPTAPWRRRVLGGLSWPQPYRPRQGRQQRSIPVDTSWLTDERALHPVIPAKAGIRKGRQMKETCTPSFQ